MVATRGDAGLISAKDEMDYYPSYLAGPVLGVLLIWLGGEPIMDRLKKEAGIHMSYLAGALADRDFIVGDRLMLADLELPYILALASAARLLAERLCLAAYRERL